MKVIAPGIAMAPGRCSDFEQKQARTALNLPANGHCILFVGNDFRKKGLPALLQSLAQQPDDVFLAVVGKGEQGDTVRKLMKELNLSARVHFVGALQNMETAYQAADCLVHPTLEDTYAMVVLEAMAHGLPVIVSGASYCGIAAELRNGIDAVILSDPRDALQLSGALRALFTNPARTEALSREALEFARSRTWQRAALAYECVYAAVLENK